MVSNWETRVGGKPIQIFSTIWHIYFCDAMPHVWNGERAEWPRATNDIIPMITKPRMTRVKPIYRHGNSLQTRLPMGRHFTVTLSPKVVRTIVHNFPQTPYTWRFWKEKNTFDLGFWDESVCVCLGVSSWKKPICQSFVKRHVCRHVWASPHQSPIQYLRSLSSHLAGMANWLIPPQSSCTYCMELWYLLTTADKICNCISNTHTHTHAHTVYMYVCNQYIFYFYYSDRTALYSLYVKINGWLPAFEHKHLHKSPHISLLILSDISIVHVRFYNNKKKKSSSVYVRFLFLRCLACF